MTLSTPPTRAWYQLPHANLINIRIFYLLSACNSAAFIVGNWIFFWTRFMTYGQLGLIDAAAFAFGLFMEVPTGAVADVIGKKRTLITAMLLQGLGFLLISSAASMIHVLIGFLIFQAGYAFYSGASEAMAYDTLKEHGHETAFERVLTTTNLISMLVFISAILLGGLMYNIHWRLPHYGNAVAYLVGFVGTWWLIEPHIEGDHFSLRGYFRQLSRGAEQLAQPTLRYYVPLLFGLLGGYYLFTYGLVQPAIMVGFGFYADAQAAIQAILGVMVAIAVTRLPWLRRRIPDNRGLVLLTFLLALGYAGAALPLGIFGFFVLMMIRMAGGLAQPWVSIVINRETESRYRATTLSTVAMIVKLPYILSAIIAGQMVESGLFWLFNMVIAVIIVGLIALSAVMRKRVAPAPALAT